MKKIILLAGLFLFLSCSKEDNPTTPVNPIQEDNTPFYIQDYFSANAQYSVNLVLNPNSDNLVKFEYDANNRIIKRIGDIIYIAGGAGGGGYISDILFTDLEYFDNKVKLTKRSSASSLIVQPHESIITFDSENKMVQKIINYQANNSQNIKHDTINYTYINNRLIHFTKTYKESSNGYETRYFEDSSVSYNNDNLSTIVTIFSVKYSDMPHVIFIAKETKQFGGYDNAINPFRKLSIFDETFYRSLSKNNFTTYTKVGSQYIYPNNDYSQTPVLGQETQQGFQNWSLNYDVNGQWLYNQP